MNQGTFGSGTETDEEDIDEIVRMSVLVDTGVLYADHDEDAARHGVADAALDEVYAGACGQPYVSGFVYGETVTLTLRRAGIFEVARKIGERMRGAGSFPDSFVVLRVSGAVFSDATTVALVRRRGLDTASSFDDFDGIVDRTDPGELVE